MNALASALGSPSRVLGIPSGLAGPALQLLDALRLSPLVDWHYKTIDKEFWFDNETPQDRARLAARELESEHAAGSIRVVPREPRRNLEDRRSLHPSLAARPRIARLLSRAARLRARASRE